MSMYSDWARPRDLMLFYKQTSEGLRLLPSLTTDITSRPGLFFGMAVDEMFEVVAKLIDELKLECVMALMASIEATFQVDLQTRSKRKLNDHVSTALRRHLRDMKRRESRIEIEDILDIWKKELGGLSLAMGNLKQAIEFRHWLAHGRYWQQKSGLRQTDPVDTWNRWQAVCDGIAKSTDFPLE